MKTPRSRMGCGASEAERNRAEAAPLLILPHR
jgi:hypothetical protein